MLALLREYDTLIAAFVRIVGKRFWPRVLVLIVGAILAPGKGTVTSVLLVMGLSGDEHFQG